jgi:CCR4-NOT complex subunit CAF16
MQVLVENLSFSYFNIDILHNINLQINEGEIILLVGENGAGKTTLLRLLSGNYTALKYDKFSVLGTRSPHDQYKGVAFLGNIWKRSVSFAGHVPFMIDMAAGEMMKKWQEENIERRNELVEVLEIDLNWRMNKVSDGQRKRVQIMLGLMKPFKFLIIDEFTNDLDVVVRDKFFNYLKKERDERNCCIIYATHIFDNIDNFATHVVFISNGITHDKQLLKDFNVEQNLFHSVKNKILANKTYINDQKLDKKLLGPQGGWSSGRSNFFFK